MASGWGYQRFASQSRGPPSDLPNERGTTLRNIQKTVVAVNKTFEHAPGSFLLTPPRPSANPEKLPPKAKS